MVRRARRGGCEGTPYAGPSYYTQEYEQRRQERREGASSGRDYTQEQHTRHDVGDRAPDYTRRPADWQREGGEPTRVAKYGMSRERRIRNRRKANTWTTVNSRREAATNVGQHLPFSMGNKFPEGAVRSKTEEELTKAPVSIISEVFTATNAPSVDVNLQQTEVVKIVKVRDASTQVCFDDEGLEPVHRFIERSALMVFYTMLSPTFFLNMPESVLDLWMERKKKDEVRYLDVKVELLRLPAMKVARAAFVTDQPNTEAPSKRPCPRSKKDLIEKHVTSPPTTPLYLTVVQERSAPILSPSLKVTPRGAISLGINALPSKDMEKPREWEMDNLDMLQPDIDFEQRSALDLSPYASLELGVPMTPGKS